MVSDVEPVTSNQGTATIRMRALPSHWWLLTSWDIYEEDRRITTMDAKWRWFGDRPNFEIDERRYEFGRERWFGDFVLLHEGRVLCRASKRRCRRTFMVSYQTEQFSLSAKSLLTQQFVLSQGNTACGSVSPFGFFSKGVSARLPERLPTAIRVFLVWLVTDHWLQSQSGG